MSEHVEACPSIGLPAARLPGAGALLSKRCEERPLKRCEERPLKRCEERPLKRCEERPLKRCEERPLKRCEERPSTMGSPRPLASNKLAGTEHRITDTSTLVRRAHRRRSRVISYPRWPREGRARPRS
jgi:hypothetical protein